MLGEGIGEHVGKPVAESLLALQLQRVVIRIANVVVHLDRSISRERFGCLQIGIASRPHLVELRRTKNVQNPVPDIGNSDRRVAGQQFLNRNVPLVGLVALDVDRGGDHGRRHKRLRAVRPGRFPALQLRGAPALGFESPVRRPNEGGCRSIAGETACKDAVPGAHDEIISAKRPPRNPQTRRNVAVSLKQPRRSARLRSRNPQVLGGGRQEGSHRLRSQVHFPVLVLACHGLAQLHVERGNIAADGGFFMPVVPAQSQIQRQTWAEPPKVLNV